MHPPETDSSESSARPRPGSAQLETVEWTPLLGAIRGTMACGAASVVLAGLWYVVARYLPESSVAHLRDGVQESMGPLLITGRLGFVSAWVLFAVVHRASGLVGGICPVIVAFFVIVLTLVKQLVLVKYGVKLPSGFVDGWTWMEPVRVLKANIATWLGLILAIAVFRKGESITDLFGT
jgi:hypothetical protein